jgi:hypothetical protein
LGGLGSKGAIFFHCASVSNGPDRAIDPPSALLTLLIPHFTKLNHSHFRGLSQVVQQPLLSCLRSALTDVARANGLFAVLNGKEISEIGDYRLVKHARYYSLLLAQGHLSRRLFGSMLRMIAALPLPDA